MPGEPEYKLICKVFPNYHGPYTPWKLQNLFRLSIGVDIGHRGAFFAVASATVFRLGQWAHSNNQNLRLREGDWAIDVSLNHSADGPFQEWLKSQGKEARPAWKELSIQLARWHTKAGGKIEYSSRVPKEFMHPSHATMKPIFAAPKELELGDRILPRHYKKPEVRKITSKETEFSLRWFGKGNLHRHAK